MTLVDPPKTLEQGLVGWSPIAKVSGSGSISTVSIEESDAQAAQERRGPLGFSSPAATSPGQPSPAERLWGEAVWTARDLV